MSGDPAIFPVAVSQTTALRSSLAVTTLFPSGLKAANKTPSLCQNGSPTFSPVTTSQTWAYCFVMPPAPLAVTTCRPSELNSTWLTLPGCDQTCSCMPVIAFQRYAFVPAIVTSLLASGLRTACSTRLGLRGGKLTL